MELKYPKLFVVTGPSGVGKTEICRRLFEEKLHNLRRVVTCTTRERRNGEIHGKDYLFYSQEEFSNMVKRAEMLEHAEVYGECYGSRIEDVEKKIKGGWSPLLTVDIQGALTMRQKYDPIISIFIKTPNINDLETLLNKRNTESKERIAMRIAAAPGELAQEHLFKYVVTNHIDRFDDTFREVVGIISSELIYNHKISKPIT